jgi:tetratricopeptide (TPR) repeat protein
VYLWLAILLQGKGEVEAALKIYDDGININPMWDFLLKNKVMALASMNNREAALALQEKLIAKASLEPPLQRKRYAELARLQWSFNNKPEALAAAKSSGDFGLIKFMNDGDHSLLQKSVDSLYDKQTGKGEYISQLWMGLDYAHAGAREKALVCFNNAIALKEAAISLLLIPDFEFLNIKYLNMALITRKVKQLINF